jgi:alpha-tubulin suppressor-like RCC1 family protein
MTLWGSLFSSVMGRARCLLVVVLAAGSVTPAGARAEGVTGKAAVGWGSNLHGGLGAGFKSKRQLSPVTVQGLTNIEQMDANFGASYALLSSGTVLSWGANELGDLGQGYWGGSTGTPTEVPGLSGVVSISAGGYNAYALLDEVEGGKVMSWGLNDYGQLGDEETGEADKPIEVKLKEPAVKLWGHFALLKDGALMAWGSDRYGALGLGTPGPERCKGELGEQPCTRKPIEVDLHPPAGVTIEEVAGGREAAYALLSNGHVFAWGRNNFGQLGDGRATEETTDVPREVPGLANVTAISGGDVFALALLSNGTVFGWGGSGGGAIGQAGYEHPETCGKHRCRTAPVQVVPGLEHATAIDAGYSYSLAVQEGRIYAFGENKDGQLGLDKTSAPISVPTEVRTEEEEGVTHEIAHVIAVVASNHHSLAIQGEGAEILTPPVEARYPANPTPGQIEIAWRVEAPWYQLNWGIDPNTNNYPEAAWLSNPTRSDLIQLSPELETTYHFRLITHEQGKSGSRKEEAEKKFPSKHYKLEEVEPYFPPVPHVTGVTPTEGPEGGGTSVTITGKNLTGATAVHFGTAEATSFEQPVPGEGEEEGTSITAVAPPGKGTVDVTVTTPEGESAKTTADYFTYFPPPTNSSPPTIAGKAQVGETLTEQHGSWMHNPTSYTYQWLQCNALGEVASCVPIVNATGQTYVPTLGDVGHTIRVQETAANASGTSAPATSAATEPVVP